MRNERIKPTSEEIPTELFKELKVVYHESEKEITNKYGATFSIETILRGEISYKDYSHGEILIDSADAELTAGGSVIKFLKEAIG